MRSVLGALCLATLFLCACDGSTPQNAASAAGVEQPVDNKPGIRFATVPWKDVLERARKENRLVFVDFYTDWCKPCKQMANEIFPRKDVGEFFNAAFINYKIDAEKGEGPDVSRSYGVGRAFPTYLFVRGDGVVVYRSEAGSMPAEAFLREAKLALQEKDAPKPFVNWVREYNSGQRGKEFLLGYLKKSATLEAPSALVIEEAFGLLDASDLKNKDILASMLYAGPKIEYVPGGKLFKYVVEHHDSLDAMLETRTLDLLQLGLNNYFATSVAGGGDQQSVSATGGNSEKGADEKDLAVAVAAHRRVAKLQGQARATIEVSAKRMVMEFQSSRLDTKAMVEAARDYVENGIYKLDIKGMLAADAADEEKRRNAAGAAQASTAAGGRMGGVNRMASVAFALRDAAETVYRAHTDDATALARAEGWTRRAAEYTQHYSIAAVQAGLLFRQGKEPQAVERMKAASQDPDPQILPETRALLEKNVDRLDRGEAPVRLWRWP